MYELFRKKNRLNHISCGLYKIVFMRRDGVKKSPSKKKKKK